MSAVLPGEPDIRVDLDEWKQFGSGGFGAVYSNAAEPSHVLKQLYGEVSLADSLRAKKEHSSHARVIRERLSEILGGQASDFESRIRGQLHDAVTSHVGYSQSSSSVYLYQRLAMGMPLQAAYQHDPPSWITRLKVAQNFAAAMDELCRCRVIHLDCGASNVFVDLQAGDPRVTLIDLDGCGIPNRDDRWHTPPLSFGQGDDNARPVWFPFDGSWQLPVSGNFIFAERWCILNEVWRMIAWGDMDALGWLASDCERLFEARTRARAMFAEGMQYFEPVARPAYWLACQRCITDELSADLEVALAQTFRYRWKDEAGLGSGSAADEAFLCELAAVTLLGFVDPKHPWLPHHRTPDIPSARWVQNALEAVSRAQQT